MQLGLTNQSHSLIEFIDDLCCMCQLQHGVVVDYIFDGFRRP